MDHDLAHIVTKKDNIWIQGTYLKNGLAYTYTAPKQDALLTEMLNAEKTAIKSKTGLWGDTSPHKIQTPDTLKGLKGEFVVVEGKVQKVASVRNNIYLNFGKDWKTDFTIMLSPSDRKTLAKRYIDPLQLANERVQVRGWLREYNGPLIELEDTAHLQILGKNSTLPAVTK